MSDTGAIGLIIEELSFVIEDMNNTDELSDDNFLFGLCLLKIVVDECIQQNIELHIDDEHIKYMDTLIKNSKSNIKKDKYDKVHMYQQRLNECVCFDEAYNLCDEVLYGWECELNNELRTMNLIK